MSWLLLWGVALGAVLAVALHRPVMGLLVTAEAVRPNYAGRRVPVAGGLVFILATFLAQTLQWLLAQLTPGCAYPAGQLATAALTLLGFALLGLVDDLLGSREAGGFRGHFRLLFTEGRLTSGALKALGGAVVAAWAAVGTAVAQSGMDEAGGWWVVSLPVLLGSTTVNLLLIALTANAVNLLDLRPGRAFKGFLLLGILAFTLSRPWPGGSGWLWLAPLFGAAAAFAVRDLRAEVMMGDTGANALGAAVGLGVVWNWGLAGKLLWLLGLLLFHLYTERASLSAAIDRVALLRWLDRLGRPADGKDGSS